MNKTKEHSNQSDPDTSIRKDAKAYHALKAQDDTLLEQNSKLLEENVELRKRLYELETPTRSGR